MDLRSQNLKSTEKTAKKWIKIAQKQSSKLDKMDSEFQNGPKFVHCKHKALKMYQILTKIGQKNTQKKCKRTNWNYINGCKTHKIGYKWSMKYPKLH